MSTITKEWLQKAIKQHESMRNEIPFGLDEGDSNTLAALRIALASLEAEAVAWLLSGGGAKNHVSFDSGNAYADPLREVTPLYTAPPAPVSVPDAMEMDDDFDSAFEHGKAVGWNACRAAMLQGADSELLRKAAIQDALCEKYNVESLSDFVDWQRNHITELEAAPPAPVGPGEPAVMPDYPGYTMTQRECFQAGKKAGMAEAGNSPVIAGCSCRNCRPVTMTDMRFVVCPDCGNKRCPHANDHRNACTGSNEPGQEGSAYPAAPQREA